MFFRVRTVKPQLIERRDFFMITFSFFFFKFFQQSCVSAGPDGFFRTGSSQPVRPYARQLSLWFLWGLRVWDFTGLMMTIMHKQSVEEFMNVFNSSILYCLTADSKRMEYSVNVTKLVQLQSSISDFWSIACLSSVSQLLSVS